MKGFKVVDYISFPLPKLSWRNCIDRSKFGRSLRRSFLEIRDQNLDKLRRRLGSAAAGGGNTMSAGNIRTISDGRGGMYVDEFVGEEHVATGWDIDFELTRA